MQAPLKKHKSREHIGTGLILIAIGIVFLCNKFNIFSFVLHWYLFPTLVFSILGLIEIFSFQGLHKVCEGLSKIALAAWFYISFSGLWGMSPANTWPLILIIIGIGLVLKSLLKPVCKNKIPQDQDIQ